MSKKLDILLAIVPRIVDDFGYTPAGAALLKGSLKQAGFNCKIIDFNSEIDRDFQNTKTINQINNFFLFNDFYHHST